MSEQQWGVEDLLKYGKEMKDDPRKVFEIAGKLLKVRDREGVERPLRANRVQKEFERRRGQRNIVLKARQMGISTWVAARFFLKTITARGVMTVQVAHTKEAAESIFRMAQRFWECLPEKLRDGPLRRNRANSGQMRFTELDSEFRVMSAGDVGAGRGLTMQNLHCSELSRWPGNASETLAGMRAALAPGGELVMESTPNGAYGCFYEEWGQAIADGAGGNGVVRHFFPWWLEEAYVSSSVTDFTDDEQALILTHGLTAEQIGFRRSLEASYRGLRVQEFAEDAETCFKATGDCCFEAPAVEARLAQLDEPMGTLHNGALQVWLPPISGKQYLVAADPAGGGPDGDFAAVQVIDMESGMQCAELQQRLTPLDLAKAAAKLAREYHGAIIAVERNNHGHAVLAFLSTVEHYANVYGQEGQAGWLTSAGSKPGMISRMGALLVESPEMFSSRRLLGECRTYISLPGGGTGAANGAHDDCVMAMAIAQAVREELIVRKR
ncbi:MULTISPECIES: terminase [Acidobacteriaceae]|uniref:terminase n=1 Tax=Acidobacteriaceae TaxID=204434 RepID=UPI00131CC1EF|nr:MULTISPECIES: terminase [Acidobacteriaceae]MDW5265705.1 terminase [Edaphobacter sp.]